MTEEDILKINIDTLTEEEAHIKAVDIIKEDIDRDKAAVKRGAIIAAIMSAALFLTGKDGGFLTYGLMGLDSMTLISTFTCLSDMFEKRKKLRRIEDGSFNESYVDLVRKAQDYIKSKTSQVEMETQRKK